MDEADKEIIDRMRKQRAADEETRQRTQPDYSYRGPVAPSHEEIVENRLQWIKIGVWIIAAAVMANFVSGIIIAASAASTSSY